MEAHVLFFIYGLLTMFYGLMSWMFWRKNTEMLSRLVSVLMLVSCVQCLKDIIFMLDESYWEPEMWRIMTAVDMVVIPIYGFILIELIRPGSLRWRTIVVHEMPFVLLPLGLIITGIELVYDINVVWAAVYGTHCVVWMVINIPKYHEQLKRRFSYSENVNLRWLRVILYSFVLILVLWIVDCYAVSAVSEVMYLLGSLVMWMAISYFIYRHESVLEEFADEAEQAGFKHDDADGNTLAAKIEHFFLQDKAFLNPRLRLSDVAKAVGSNRSYVSHYFNSELEITFFDYVNGLRVEYACGLLSNTTDSIDVVAMSSGFNSPSTFYRVFSQVKGCTPAIFRGGGGKSC